ncbi:MAG: HAD family hydrolase [Desulfopila sp.]
MRPADIRIVFTDLDGTLLNGRGRISAGNRQGLVQLGAAGIIRVVATGRSPFSFNGLTDQPLPIDYLICSSGAAIFELPGQKLLFSAHLDRTDIARISQTLMDHEVDFMVHEQVPDNHRFVFMAAGGGNDDFSHRLSRYRDFAREYDSATGFPRSAAQIITVMADKPALLARLAADLSDYQVTRTTSPLDHRSVWLEIQPPGIHKGSAAAWLCRHLDIAPAAALGIGNDYNDLDLLDFTGHSFLVANSPLPLHHRYRLVPSNDQDGFLHGLRTALDGN